MKKLLKKFAEYLKYPSTYKGIIALLTTLGVVISEEQSEAIALAGVSLYGAISIFFSDSDVKENK